MKSDYLKSRLMEYLDRRSIPQHMAGNEKAQASELAALLRAVLANAPDSGFQEWWPRMEDAIDSIMRTRVWPTVNEVRAGARLVQKNGFTSGKKAEPLAASSINLRRLRAGEPLGDEWLFGEDCISLLSEGATEDDFTPYRSALFFADKGLVGWQEARRREDARQKRHDMARESAGMSVYFSAPKLTEDECRKVGVL